MRKIGLIICLSLLPVLLFGQDIRKIKENPSFLWGEGTGKDYESMQASAVDALIRKLSSTDLIGLPSGHEYAVWKTYRNDIISVSDVVWDSGTALRYIAWKEVDKIFSRRKRLSSELYSRAVKASSAGKVGEAAACSDWALTLLEVLPEDNAAKAALKAMRKKLGDVEPTTVPGLSYVGREVEEIRKALEMTKPMVSAKVSKERPSETVTISDPGNKISIPALARIPERWPLAFQQNVPRLHLQPRAVLPAPPDGRTTPVHYLAVAQIAAFPSVETGLFLGLKKGRTGGYLSFRTGFQAVQEDYVCSSDGQADFGHIWASGLSKYTRLTLSGGIIVGNSGGLACYAGAGYGSLGCFWEDVSGQWAKVKDKSFQGILVESGLFWTAGKIVLTAGLSSVSFSTLSPTIGLGICF